MHQLPTGTAHHAQEAPAGRPGPLQHRAMGQHIRLFLGKESQRRGEVKRTDSGGSGTSTSCRLQDRCLILSALATPSAFNQSTTEALMEPFSAQGPGQAHMRAGRRAKELHPQAQPSTNHGLLLMDKDPSFPQAKVVFPGSQRYPADLSPSAHKSKLLINVPCLGSLLFPVSLPPSQSHLPNIHLAPIPCLKSAVTEPEFENSIVRFRAQMLHYCATMSCWVGPNWHVAFCHRILACCPQPLRANFLPPAPTGIWP